MKLLGQQHVVFFDCKTNLHCDAVLLFNPYAIQYAALIDDIIDTYHAVLSNYFIITNKSCSAVLSYD